MNGAEPAIGIDDENHLSVLDISLDDKLNLLSDMGVSFAVIEGFKRRPFKKVLIGDLDCEYLLKDPNAGDVLDMLDQFDDWYTLSGLMKELGNTQGTGSVYSWSGYATDYPEALILCNNIEKEYATDSRISGIRARVQKWAEDDRHPVFIVMAVSSTNDGTVFSEVLSKVSSCTSE